MEDVGESSDVDDDELSVLPLANEPMRFDEFFRSAYAPLLRLMISFTRRPNIAEELTQEALFTAYRRWSHVQHLDRPDLWLRRIAVNRAISRHRRLLTEVAAIARLRTEPPPEHAAPTDEAVWAAVRRLPRRQAAAIALWSVSGYTLAEIGEVLGCSEETARTHLRRARQRLAEDLEDYR